MKRNTIRQNDPPEPHVQISSVEVKPGRKPLSGEAMTTAERSRRHRAKVKQERMEREAQK